MIKINNNAHDVVVGSMLGDGYIRQEGALQLHHGSKQKDYMDYKYNLLKEYCNHEPKIDKRGSVLLVTSQKYFKQYRDEWYKNNKKNLPNIDLRRKENKHINEY